MNGPAPSGWLERTGQVVLAAAGLLAAFFFFSRWGINAEALGARDAGWALFLSFANALAIYACIAVSALSGSVAVIAALTGRAWRVHVWAFLVALLPIVFLAVRDQPGR